MVHLMRRRGFSNRLGCVKQHQIFTPYKTEMLLLMLKQGCSQSRKIDTETWEVGLEKGLKNTEREIFIVFI